MKPEVISEHFCWTGGGGSTIRTCLGAHIKDRMPAKDKYHETVKRALVKAGWTITAEQISVLISKRWVWIDLQATKTNQTATIFVEVKGFGHRSPVTFLSSAIGQYALYQDILAFLRIDTPVYMAVPIRAYRGIWSEPLGKLVLESRRIKLIVFDPQAEEVVQWIN